MLTADINRQMQAKHAPGDQQIRNWAQLAWRGSGNAEVSIVIVDEDAIRELNNSYRGKDSATNVLSFPADLQPIEGSTHLGDIVLCAPVIDREANHQQKNHTAHWAHMIIHGMLHLQNYDHIDDSDAQEMEALEISLLSELAFANPYH